MPVLRSKRRLWGWALLAIVACGLRVAAVALLWPAGLPPTFEHGEIASRMLAGEGFAVTFLGHVGPTSQQAPLYPTLLAGLYALFGVDSPGALLAMQLLQCLAGTVSVLLVAWLARHWVPERPAVAWTAGIAAAVYPPHVYMVTHIQVATWATLALTGLLALAATRQIMNRPRGLALLGLSIGLTLLIEPIHALAVPVVLLAALLTGRVNLSGRRETATARPGAMPGRPAAASCVADAVAAWHPRMLRAPLARLALVATVALAVLAPWLARNRRVHGEWVFVKSTFGYAFWQGNNPHSWGTDKVPKPLVESDPGAATPGTASPSPAESPNRWAHEHRALWAARHETWYIDDVVLRPAGYQRFAGLSEPARSRLLGREARAWITSHPGSYLGLCANRLRYFLLFDETNPKAGHPLYRASSIVWLVLASVGLLSGGACWRRWWPGVAVFLVLTLFHTLVISSARFRLPLEGFSLVWVAWAVVPVVSRLAARARVWWAVAPEKLPAEATRRRTQGPPIDPPHGLRGPHVPLRGRREESPARLRQRR